jgi:methyl-accepting chemotaxis protein
MDGDAGDRPGFQPLVPPLRDAVDPVALHRHGVELIAASNRLALTWLAEATAQQVAITRRALADMTAMARGLAGADGAAEQARAMLEALARAQQSGLETTQAITGLMQRIQEDSTAILGRALPGSAPDERS